MNTIKNYSFGTNISSLKMHREKLKFCLSLHNKHSIRSSVQDIIDKYSFFISELFIPYLTVELQKVVKDKNTLALITNILDKNKNPFSNYSTESRRFNVFRTDSIYVDPDEFQIGDKNVKTLIQDVGSVIPAQVFATFIPLKRTLKSFFELPGMFVKVKKYKESLEREKEVISNFIQAELWQTKYKEFAKIFNCFPVFVFFDDFQPRSAFGANAADHKLGGVYISIPCLPPDIVSKMTSIFLHTIFHSKDREAYGNANVFRKIISDLNHIAKEGVLLDINGSNVVLYFKCVLILGDNLGLNCTCGFSQSFSANYYCRICNASNIQCKNLNQEVDMLLRQKNTYEMQVLVDDAPNTGVMEKCVFNEIDDFHIIENGCYARHFRRCSWLHHRKRLTCIDF